ncbi:MAG: hypothetical protein IOB09_34330, partial [Burkholderia sp.]|nr:hypothetical protein [Burkholderia sp.]
MRAIQADGRAAAVTGLTVATLFALALTLNAMLPALGAMEPSATCTLLVAVAGVIALIVARPVFAVSVLYTLVIGLTAFVAGVGDRKS